jgi:hypothetical protein
MWPTSLQNRKYGNIENMIGKYEYLRILKSGKYGNNTHIAPVTSIYNNGSIMGILKICLENNDITYMGYHYYTRKPFMSVVYPNKERGYNGIYYGISMSIYISINKWVYTVYIMGKG